MLVGLLRVGPVLLHLGLDEVTGRIGVEFLSAYSWGAFGFFC